MTATAYAILLPFASPVAAVYASNLNNGLSTSTDGGTNFTTYTTANSGLGDIYIHGMFVAGGAVYAATDNDGLSIGPLP